MTGMAVGITFLSFTYHNVMWIFFGLCGAYYSAARSHAPEWRVRFGIEDAALIAGLDLGYIALVWVYLAHKHV